MAKRLLFYRFFLWWSMIGLSIWIGGTVFSMCVIVPMWSQHPPESVRFFFGQTSFNTYIWNFFGPPFMLVRNGPLLFTLILGWYVRPQRNYLLAALACTLFGIIYTLVYIYSINDILMTRAGGNQTGEVIKTMTGKWIAADRLRFGVMLAGYFCLLKAFRLQEMQPPKKQYS